MSVTAAPATTSNAPADDHGLGPWKDADFSSEAGRREILDGPLRYNCAKTTSKTFTFSSCCGAAVVDEGEKCCYFPFGYFANAIPNLDPRQREFYHNGTVQGMRASAQALLDAGYTELYYASTGYYPVLSDKSRDYRADTKRLNEDAFIEQVRAYSIEKFNILFAWGRTQEQAAEKFITGGTGRRERVQGMDFNDPVDGQACLIWVNQ